ncbi:MAG TPA: hypothetical protein ACHBX0_02610 [Arsenophonus sp.]
MAISSIGVTSITTPILLWPLNIRYITASSLIWHCIIQSNNFNDSQPIYSLSHRSSQYSASLSLKQYGNIGLVYLDIYSFNGDKNRLLNLSWSKGLWGNSNLYASASRDYSQNNWSFALVLQIPFNFLDSVTLDTQHNTAG